MKMVNAKGEAVYFNRAWKHGKETWVVQGIGETLVIGRDRQKRRSRTFTQLPQAESRPLSLDFSNGKNTLGKRLSFSGGVTLFLAHKAPHRAALRGRRKGQVLLCICPLFCVWVYSLQNHSA